MMKTGAQHTKRNNENIAGNRVFKGWLCITGFCMILFLFFLEEMYTKYHLY